MFSSSIAHDTDNNPFTKLCGILFFQAEKQNRSADDKNELNVFKFMNGIACHLMNIYKLNMHQLSPTFILAKKDIQTLPRNTIYVWDLIAVEH